MDKDFLIRLVERLRFEILAQKVDFDEDIEVLGEEIKSNWWKENKSSFIDEAEADSDDFSAETV